MSSLNREQLVELITKEVEAALGKAGVTEEYTGKGKSALVIGAAKKLPLNLTKGFALRSIEDYAACGDICCYDEVLISQLSTTELVEIALGKPSRPVQCAVLKALMCGKKVKLLESGIEHRQYLRSANPKLFALYESYVTAIITFGVELVREQKQSTVTLDKAAENSALIKVITEAVAKKLVSGDNEKVVIAKSAVITPSAKDVLNHSGKTVELV